MREEIKQFIKICSETLPVDEPIYEFGALQVPTQVGFADLRPLFPDKKFVGADMREGDGVDVILNLHDIDLPPESVGTVLVMDTLEHVEYVRKAMEEVHKILKKNGILIMSSVMNFPIHDHPYDYWRFTPEAFKSLLKPFDESFVGYMGKEDFPHTIIGVGFKGKVSETDIRIFKEKFSEWKQRYGKCILRRKSFKEWVKPIIPPAALDIFRKIKNTDGS